MENKEKKFTIIVSVGPSLLSNQEKLQEIDSYGNCIYRLNGAHLEPSGVSSFAKNLRESLRDPLIMLDLPGNKVRTKNLFDPIRLVKGYTVDLHKSQVNYPEFYTLLKPGDIILAQDATLTLKVKSVSNETIHAESHSDGLLLNNKGLHVPGIHEKIPFVFEKDLQLIKVACQEKLQCLSLSFVRNKQDIEQIKAILEKEHSSEMEIFAKIETAAALENLEEILSLVNQVNVDRGDLSSDIGLLNLPEAQEKIISTSKKHGKDIYLATQFLKNMEENPVPLIAEVMDLAKTLGQGVSGIQLSEETAIGKYPEKCVKLIFDIKDQCSI